MRRPEIIEAEIIALKAELIMSQVFYKVKPQDESLRISDWVRNNSNGHFIGRTYFRDHMEKLVWEEDD
jgi:hypothetical protein